jgi:hypothetical protein
MRYLLLISVGILVVVCVWSARAQDKKWLTSATIDVNGDGVKERITLTISPDKERYTLRIGNATAQGRLEPEIEGFKVIDIDISDHYKEIAVHTSGPSDDDEYVIYWYSAGKLRQVADIGRWPRFTGAGIVYVKGWMNFWESTERYVLDKKTHMLRKTPQSSYYVGVKGPARKQFPLFTTAQGALKGGEHIANLREKSIALILLWDPVTKCYLVKSESDVVGWTTEQVIIGHMEVPLAD